MTAILIRAIDSELGCIEAQIQRLEAQKSALVRLLARVSGEAVAEVAPKAVEPLVKPVAEAKPAEPYRPAQYRHGQAWTPAEIEILRETYASGGADAALKALPHRTRAAIIWRASDIGVSSGNGLGGELWTADENQILIEHYPAMGRKVAALLPNRATTAIYSRVQKLGVKRDRWKSKVSDVECQPSAEPPVLTKQPRPERTFPEQLEAVRNGAKLVDVVPIRTPAPERTLGGVVGPIT